MPSGYVKEGEMKTEYPVIIAGDNFGCGSSREHAPISLGASGTQCVVAESYARIFFRNCVSTGELYPVETPKRICEEIETGEGHTLNVMWGVGTVAAGRVTHACSAHVTDMASLAGTRSQACGWRWTWRRTC